MSRRRSSLSKTEVWIKAWDAHRCLGGALEWDNLLELSVRKTMENLRDGNYAASLFTSCVTFGERDCIWDIVAFRQEEMTTLQMRNWFFVIWSYDYSHSCKRWFELLLWFLYGAFDYDLIVDLRCACGSEQGWMGYCVTRSLLFLFSLKLNKATWVSYDLKDLSIDIGPDSP